MTRLIRNNQKVFVAALAIVSMITFVVAQRGQGNTGTANDVKYGTINGKPVYTSELADSRAELSALIHSLNFTGEERDTKAQLMRALITQFQNKPELFPLLRHEAISDKVQVNNDDVDGVLATYTKDLDPESDGYYTTRAGVTDLLKIIARYDQVVSAVKVSKPLADLAVIREGESIQMDLIQFQASDFIAKVPAPTTQQMNDQFNKYADQAPHHPIPATNPFGFGYRLPVRASLQYVILPSEAVNAAVIATKSSYDWEVQARKYYLANTSEFAMPTTTSPTTTTASTQPTGPQPFATVHDKILTNIRKPLVTALMDQVQSYLSSTLNSDWQAYSQSLNSDKPTAANPIAPYVSPDYLTKLIAQVQTRFKVAVTSGQTAPDLSQEQISALPVIGTSSLGDAAIEQATSYLATDFKSPSRPAQLVRPSAPLQAADGTSTVFFRLTQAKPSQSAPDLTSVQQQVMLDLKTAAAYQLALDQAKALAANARNLPLPIVSLPKNPLIHLDHLTMEARDIPEIKPELGDSAPSFIKQAFQLLGPYDPKLNHNPAAAIELPEQFRVFAAQLSFVDARWNNDNFFYLTMAVRDNALHMQQMPLMRRWFDFDSVVERLQYKPNAKNSAS